MPSPSEAFIALTKLHGTVLEPTIRAAFEALPPITDPAFLYGEWTGGSFENDHPGHATLKSMRWAGKNFRDVNDVDPIVVYDDQGKRAVGEAFGASSARLRKVELWGKLSVAMVYDKNPIIDQFRFVGEDLVAGAMDVKPDTGRVYYFYLKRNKNGEGEKL
ncbi:uncharacterized protein BDZ99DRAFT_464911 [Mytilinidion resinicola]|uniref:GXWXG domain-containing protein n=1 Tax=Mytilinidion resinicola TaxID=574789 RepID=A0A6A6YGS5_9PEZI|nr:uncharacterized protein BDZ99DRAFT_464911 [Mytilinidion resinicola]KAF2808016.1 hypothetical protein BDZ99DRAFT_464911 [Mytilinidion resinicola]